MGISVKYEVEVGTEGIRKKQLCHFLKCECTDRSVCRGMCKGLRILRADLVLGSPIKSQCKLERVP